MKNESRVIALVGAPNCGKTSLFNALSGLNQKVGNFPGVTVERKTANISLPNGLPISLVDLPGVNSLYPHSEDEQITFDILHNIEDADVPDQVVVLSDATQLRRGLMLASQVIDLGYPVILGLTMMDLAEDHDIRIDEAKLSKLLGIPVVGLSLKNKKKGLAELKSLLQRPVDSGSSPVMKIPPGFKPILDQIKPHLRTERSYPAYQALVSPESFSNLDQEMLAKLRAEAKIDHDAGYRLVSNELLVRLDRADEILSEVILDPPTEREQITEKIDAVLTHPVWGYLIFLAVLVMVFQAIFAWASYPMDLIDAGFGALSDGVKNALPAGWFTNLLTDGLITGLGGIVIFVPQIAFLFFFITMLEESGYMARVVFLMDRIMRPFGFSGRSVIPLMGGMACAIPSIMMSRSIPNRSERIITIMVTPLMSCSARIPVYTLLIAMFIPKGYIWGIDQRGLFMAAIYLLGFVMALLVAWIFKTAFKYRSGGMFLMELPTYRVPRWRNVGLTVYQKSSAFVTEAGKIILVISLVLWFLVSYGPSGQQEKIEENFAELIESGDLSEEQLREIELAQESEKLNTSYAAMLGKVIEPVIKPLGYDWKIGISLITSFAAREVFVGTMSVIYQQQDPDSMEDAEQGRLTLIERLQRERDPETGKLIYTPAVVLSLIVFYAIAMQCMSTLAVTRKELGWGWTGVMLTYLTLLAYLASFITYQLMA